MTAILDRLLAEPAFEALRSAVESGGEVRVTGAHGSFGPYLAAGVARALRTALVYVAIAEEAAECAAEDVSLFLEGSRVEIFSYPLLGQDRDALHATRRVLAALGDRAEPPVVTAELEAALQEVPSAEALARASVRLATGAELDPEDLVRRLVDAGYDPVPAVEYRGEVSRRGGIVDVFTHEAENPVRFEFFGDSVDSIRTFEVGTQRSIATVSELTLWVDPPEGAPRATLLDHLRPGTIVFLAEPEEMQARLGPAFEAFLASARRHRLVLVSEFGASGHRFDVGSPAHFGGDLSAAIRGLGELRAGGRDLWLCCGTEARVHRLGRQLADEGLPAGNGLRLAPGRLTRGFVWSSAGLAALGYHELFGRPPRRARRGGGPGRTTAPLDDFLHLEVGDFVVHLVHGIGRYRGIGRIEQDGEVQEYLKIEYRGASILHVPVTQTDLVHKYVGARGHVPNLDKIGGKSWAGKMAKVAESLREMADELLEVQAERSSRPGFAFPPDDWLQREFEASFEYEETEDQIKVADEVATDMATPRPMDRLVCGDVGYGKTEIAVRAAFRAARADRQTAILVPTTILAEQHYRTFSRRMAGYPVTVEVLSRFRTQREQTAILERLASGEADVVIGTHRLLQKDVLFHDLGLLVIDEEQRFGVKDKERLKRLKKTVDCLTLSATPIPRTLHMSLLGIRDISTLATPPPHRLPVATQVSRWDTEMVRRALERELERQGQIYVLHNRVLDIRALADKIGELVPSARILVGHGQMDEKDLEEVMTRFVDGEADILVSTTIVENGLDIPNANTILIHRAEHFGLSELHQLRGRVGRMARQAYCLLLIPENGVLTPESKKRLKAIQDHQELGSGFQIAMRDLEIRGAGNILGSEQSGHIATVGYDIFTRLLKRTVAEMKGEDPEDDGLEPGPMIDLKLDAHVPDRYVPDVQQRLSLYRRLSSVSTLEEADRLSTEVADRFGPVPRPVQTLLSLARVKARAAECGITLIRQITGRFVVQAHELDEDAGAFFDRTGLIVRPIDPQTVHLVLPDPLPKGREPIDYLLRG